jgi:hypothetical protein
MTVHQFRARIVMAGAPLLMLLVGVASGSGQTVPVAGSTTLDRVVSPRVVSTYVIRGNRVALLVLWRTCSGSSRR